MKRFLTTFMFLAMLAGLVFANGGGDTAAPSSTAAPMVDKVEEAAMAYFAGLEGSNIIKEDEFLNKVKAGESMTIVDIRSATDYAAGHVKGAVNLPWGPDLAAGFSKIPQSGSVYVYCYTGQTAGQAIAIMRMAGIPAVSVRYGFVRGISMVEGNKDLVVTDAAMASGSYPVDPAIQSAVTAYFAKLGDAPFKNNIVAAADAAAILKAGDTSVQFVDVRSAEDYAKGHIKGALSLPYAKGMQASFADLPANKKLIVNCYSGQTAGQVVAILRMLGYDAVSINSGMGTPLTQGKGWANEGFELVM